MASRLGNQAEQLRRPEHVQQLEPLEQHNANAAQVTGHGFHPPVLLHGSSGAMCRRIVCTAYAGDAAAQRPAMAVSRCRLVLPACGASAR